MVVGAVAKEFTDFGRFPTAGRVGVAAAARVAAAITRGVAAAFTRGVAAAIFVVVAVVVWCIMRHNTQCCHCMQISLYPLLVLFFSENLF